MTFMTGPDGSRLPVPVVPDGSRWWTYIVRGLLVDAFAAIIIGFSATESNVDSGPTPNTRGEVIGSVIAGLGFLIVLVGVIALAVEVGSRRTVAAIERLTRRVEETARNATRQ